MTGKENHLFTGPCATALITVCLIVSGLFLMGCRSTGTQGRPKHSKRGQPSIRRVACLYDQRPWLTKLDRAGDQDPEGIEYRVFLDPGTGKGVWIEGTLRIEMYQIERNQNGKIERTLVSDWVYPTSAFNTVRSRLLGKGYHLYLRWHSKDIAGHEIEIVTQFEDANGWIVRAGTKRFPIPKYSS